MRLLIDTHVFVRTISGFGYLPRVVRAALIDPDNDVLVSAVAAYEIEYKRERDPDLARLPRDLQEAAVALRFEWAAVEVEHAALAGRLPRLHGDPCDRVIVAQALSLRATVVTGDGMIGAYGVPVLW